MEEWKRRKEFKKNKKPLIGFGGLCLTSTCTEIFIQVQ